MQTPGHLFLLFTFQDQSKMLGRNGMFVHLISTRLSCFIETYICNHLVIPKIEINPRVRAAPGIAF